jgi:hypothetical protein
VDPALAKREEAVLKRVLILCFGLLLVLSIPGIARTRSSAVGGRPAYRHAYYLFIKGAPKGCEDCYVPLLITTRPLEQLAKAKESEECVLIITYERDSIWHDDGVLSVAPGDVEAAPRFIHLRDRTYRYQEISSLEVLEILQNPTGAIPISRPLLPNASSPAPTLQELISAFQNAK